MDVSKPMYLQNKPNLIQIAMHAIVADRGGVASIWQRLCVRNRPAGNAGRAGRVVERTSLLGASPAWPDLIGATSSGDFALWQKISCENQRQSRRSLGKDGCKSVSKQSCKSSKSCLKNLHALHDLHGANRSFVSPFVILCRLSGAIRRLFGSFRRRLGALCRHQSP